MFLSTICQILLTYKIIFFIQFTLEGTIRRYYYLIQINMASIIEVNPEYISNNLYWCVFLAKHPDDNTKSNKLCRWWTDWYMYTRCYKSDDIIYGKRILVRPNTIPCSIKFFPMSYLTTSQRQRFCVFGRTF